MAETKNEISTIEYAKNELEHYHVAAKVFDTVSDYVSIHFFKKHVMLGDGDIEVRLHDNGDATVLIQKSQIFYTQDAFKAFNRISEVAYEIAYNWQRVNKDSDRLDSEDDSDVYNEQWQNYNSDLVI